MWQLYGPILLVTSGCDRLLGVDPSTSDAPNGDSNRGTPLACENVRPLPTVSMPSGLTGLPTNVILSAPSAVAVGVKPIVMLRFDNGVPGGSGLIWATASSLVANLSFFGFVTISGDSVDQGTLWRDPDGGLRLSYERAGITSIGAPQSDGLDGVWRVGVELDLPDPGSHVRGVGADGRRLVVEVDAPHAIREFERDPTTGQLTALDTMQAVNAAAGSPRHPSITSDGCRLLFELDTGKLAQAERALDGTFGTPTVIETDAQAASWPALSEDGGTLYFMRQKPAVVDIELYFLR